MSISEYQNIINTSEFNFWQKICLSPYNQVGKKQIDFYHKFLADTLKEDSLKGLGTLRLESQRAEINDFFEHYDNYRSSKYRLYKVYSQKKDEYFLLEKSRISEYLSCFSMVALKAHKRDIQSNNFELPPLLGIEKFVSLTIKWIKLFTEEGNSHYENLIDTAIDIKEEKKP